jgi:hypothetical protein
LIILVRSLSRGNENTTRIYETLLFIAEEPPGQDITININPFPIDDGIPEEEEIKKVLLKMKQGKAPGGSGITVECLQSWMKEKENLEKMDAWKKVVEFVQLAFTNAPSLPKSFGVGILVLIPKNVPDQYCEIALLEVIYKLISAIIKHCIANKIQFHESIHGFCRNRGTNTAIMEAKLRMQLAK